MLREHANGVQLREGRDTKRLTSNPWTYCLSFSVIWSCIENARCGLEGKGMDGAREEHGSDYCTAYGTLQRERRALHSRRGARKKKYSYLLFIYIAFPSNCVTHIIFINPKLWVVCQMWAAAVNLVSIAAATLLLQTARDMFTHI